MVRDTDIAWLY